MKGLLLQSLTEQRLNSLLAAPPHAVLLVGAGGSGKRSLAVALAEEILGLGGQPFADYPYKTVIAAEKDKTSIGIEAVRELEHFLSLKVPGRTGLNRAVIIEDAHLLTAEAQNALLKTLEEPPEGVFLIVTVTSEQALLPTIRSRVQAVTIQRPERAAIESYFAAKGFDGSAIKQAYAISGGLPGLMQAMLEDGDHPLRQATEKARQLLSQAAFERLLLIDELSKQRTLAQDTVFILQQMAHISLQTATGPAAAKWQAVLTSAYQAAEALAANAQPKLVLTNLMLNL